MASMFRDDRDIDRAPNDISMSLMDSSAIEDEIIPGWKDIYLQETNLADEDMLLFDESIQQQIKTVRTSFKAQETSIQIEALLPSFVQMLYSEDANKPNQCAQSLGKIIQLAGNETFASVLISSLDLCPALLHVASDQYKKNASNSLLALKVLDIFASKPLGRSIIFRSQFFYSITHILEHESTSQHANEQTVKNCLSILNKLMRSLSGEISAPLRAHGLIEILTNFLNSRDPKILLLALNSLIFVCSKDSKSRIRMARTESGVQRVIELMNEELHDMPSLASRLANLMAILSTEDDLKPFLLKRGAQSACMALYHEVTNLSIQERLLLALRNMSDRQRNDNCDILIQLGVAILGSTRVEMKNSQIAAAGMLCNLTANFLNNKKSFLSAAGNSGMKHATDLAVRVLQSNLADDNVRLAIPLLGLIKNCSSNLHDNAHPVREKIGDTGLLELLTKLTTSQSSALFDFKHEIEHSSNPGLACDFLISSLGLLGVLSLTKKNRKVIHDHGTVTVVRDLLMKTTSLAAEDAPIYGHLDLLTLKKRAFVCLHTFVKDTKIREQFVGAYDDASDIVQDFQEFVSPNDSPMCQRDALGVIAELINIPAVLAEVKSKTELHEDLKRLVHSPSEGVATYSAYILYQINEMSNNSNNLIINNVVPNEETNGLDWNSTISSESQYVERKQSSVNINNKADLKRIVPPRSESRV